MEGCEKDRAKDGELHSSAHGYAFFSSPTSFRHKHPHTIGQQLNLQRAYLEQRLHPGSIAVEVRTVKVDRRVRFGDPRCSRTVREPAGGSSEAREDEKKKKASVKKLLCFCVGVVSSRIKAVLPLCNIRSALTPSVEESRHAVHLHDACLKTAATFGRQPLTQVAQPKQKR